MDVDVGGTSVSDSESCAVGHNLSSQCDHSNNAGLCGSGKLKRSSSAPMINQLLPQGSLLVPQTPSGQSSSSTEACSIQPRVRRMSANFGAVSPLSPGGGSSRAPGRMRVFQLREEEGMDIVNREAAHERTLHSSLQVAQTLSQSWEDLALTEERKPVASNISQANIQKKDLTDQLSLNISSTGSSQSGASPTRVGRQCFSPSLQQPVRNYSFCPSPSPTKKTFTTRRSLSPIPLRPSPLGGIKRKWDLEDSFITPNKKMSACVPDRGSSGGGGLLITQPHNTGSLESTPSPAGGGSIGSVGTPESVCSSGSPGPPTRSYSPAPTPDPPPHLFKPVSPALSGSHSSNFSHSGEQSESFGGKPCSIGGEGSDASCDAMITDDTPMTSAHDLKTYQDMDLSEPLQQGTLNI